MEDHQRKEEKHMIRWIATGLTFILLTSCGLVGGPVSGVVLDAETRQPIEGAYVVAQWSGSSSMSIAESHTVCIYTDMAITDGKGRFRIPMWFFEKPGVSSDQFYIVIYQAGYEEVWPRDSNRFLMRASKKDVRERLDVMNSVVSRTSCLGNDKAADKLYPLATALYDEALALAGGAYNQDIVESFLYFKERREMGFKTAEERHLRRLKNQE